MKLVEIKLYLISYIGKLGFEDTVFIEAISRKEDRIMELISKIFKYNEID